ncbi:ribosome small subunit-dependent GTPase A [Paramylibacter kogurei]
MKDTTMTKDYSAFFGGNMGTPRKLSTLETQGWSSFFAQQTDVDEMATNPPVRITQVHRSLFQVMGDGIDTQIPAQMDATVGDWLMLDRDNPAYSRRLERKSVMKRRAAGHDRAVQLIGANIDTAFIVTSCNQDFNIARLERYLAVVFEADVTPVIILTKADLCDDVETYRTQAETISDLVSVVVVDARRDDVTGTLSQWCKPGKTVAFVGSSGVGKSTLTNALSAGNIATQGIREDDAKGRHTTTRRHLHFIPDGCAVLDTPGMRELQLTDVSAGLEDVFGDLADLGRQCHFNDCKHETEPKCAVLAAVADGTVDPVRLQRWRKLVAEDEFNSASLSERRAKDKSFQKMVNRAQAQKRR